MRRHRDVNEPSTVLPQDLRILLKGLAMLIRSATIEAFAGAAAARTIAAAPLPTLIPSLAPSLGLLLLSCP